MTPPNEHTSEGGRDDRGVPYHAESTLSSAQVLKLLDHLGRKIKTDTSVLQVLLTVRWIFVQGSLWVWSATSRGRPPDGGLALAVFHMVPRVPAAPNVCVTHSLLLISSYILLLISAKSCSLPRLALRVCSASPSSALRRLATGPP